MRRIPVLYLVNNDIEWSIYRTDIGLFSDRNNSGTHLNGSGDKTVSYYGQEKKILEIAIGKRTCPPK
jgi:hypothetical protein